MLEFLKSYNQYHIYDKAMDCELRLRAYDAITPMASFFEGALKEAYLYYYPSTSDYEVTHLDFFSLLDDTDFIKKIQYDYNLSTPEIDVIGNLIRRKSNKYKHSIFEEQSNYEVVRKCFKCVYSFSAGYYTLHSGKTAPTFDEKAFAKLYEGAVDENAYKKSETEYKKTIEDLRKQEGVDKKQISEANREIEKLKKELEKAKLEKADTRELDDIRKKLKSAEDLLNEFQARSVIQKQKEAEALRDKEKAEKELELLREEVKRATYKQSEEITNRIDYLENKYNEANSRAEKLDEENTQLQSEIRDALKEKNKFAKKVEELSKATADAARITEIEIKILDAESKKESAESSLQQVNQKLEEAQSKLYVTQSKLEEFNRKILEKIKRESSAKELLENYAPKCPKCGRTFDFRNSKFGSGYYWKCPSNGKCGAKTETVTADYYPLIEEYQRIILGDDGTEIGIVELPQQIKKKYKKTNVEFAPNPGSFEDKNPAEYLFQSISVPQEVFRTRKDNMVSLFSKFSIKTNLDSQSIDTEKHTVYSLSLRLLNRGIVLPLYTVTETTLREKFQKSSFGSINALFDYAEYTSPINDYDSAREKIFAEYYLPKVLGKNWATFVFAQAGFDVLVNDEDDSFKDQRVDFLINKNGRKIIVEIDGPEHGANWKQDNARDEILKANGYIVCRFTNVAVDNHDESILQTLKEALGEEKKLRIDTDIDDRFLVASKMCHQFAIAIIKGLEKGYIPEVANLNAYASTDLFSESEVQFILSVAIAEVYSILNNYSDIYGIERCWDLTSKAGPTIVLFLGDGYKANTKGIVIRDCALPFNYMCSIDMFDPNVLPKVADRDALEFFLSYIFGYDNGFRPGQYDAVSRFLERNDSIVLLPTGSGKSAIYQLSSFIVPGLIIVISPLISLIEDQVDNLERNRGINSAIYFASAITQDDKKRKAESKRLMQHNSTTLIYMAPERLQIPSFREDAKKMMHKNSVFGVAIDEAHCVSEWGHDFRPAYLNVGNAARRLFSKNDRSPVISALTGTASDVVLNDVRLDLNIRGQDSLVLPNTFDRNELKFSIKQCGADDKDFYLAELIKEEIPHRFEKDYREFSRLSGEDTNAGIIFTPLAKKKRSLYSALTITGKLTDSLPELGIADYFSGNPDDVEEETWKQIIRDNAKRFKDNELNLLVATKAFGMGIDKPNIRYIIHDGIPMSFEQYYQEAGRAGRDGHHSECVLLYSNDNVQMNKEILSDSLSFDDFKSKYESYDKYIYQSGCSDDISASLYFHNQTFSGVENEITYIKRVVNSISANTFDAGRTVSIRILTQFDDEEGNTVRLNRRIEEPKWIQAMVRLVILGVIQDYTYDYNGNFSVVLGNMEKDSIAGNYYNYVRGSNEGVADTERNKVIALESVGSDLVNDAAIVLINYIYTHIEQSRRRAILNMYEAANEAVKYESAEEQNRIIKERILSYFSFKGENRDILKEIENSEKGGIPKVVPAFELAPGKTVFSKKEMSRAKELSILAGRLLESKPDHPGLLLAQAVAQLIADDYDDTIVINTIAASVSAAQTRYGVDKETILVSSESIINLVLLRSEHLFDEVIDKLTDVMAINKNEFVRDLCISSAVSDDNRDYLVLKYTQLSLNRKWGKNK